MKLREAEEAFQQGRLEEAARQLREGRLEEYLPGKKLAAKLGARLADRARSHFVQGDADAAWQQLERARELVGETDEMLAARNELVQMALQAAEQELAEVAPRRALSRLEALRRRQLGGESRSTLEEVARRMEAAGKLARRGRFADAEEEYQFAARLRPDLQVIAQAREENQRRQQQCRQLDERLHRALREETWSEALSVAESLLDLAPSYRIAEDARRRAWAEVGAKVTRTAAAEPTPAHSMNETAVCAAETKIQSRNTERFLLWIDAVGGYLVCLSPEVVIGQAGATGVDVPILGDISRRHAKLRRQEESYLLDPLQGVRINGRAVDGPTLLHDGDEIELGTNVRLRFRRPHALSSSARLEFLSRHRIQPSADAVILMAESCVLGPGAQNHVVCRHWEGDVVLFRQQESLHCRALEPLEVDGKRCDGAAPLQLDSHVAGSDFSLTLEPVDS